MSAATRLFFIRHGQIAANVQRIWHGWTDSPLTETGQQQAQQLLHYADDKLSKVAAIYSSPLQRTMNTAAPLSERLGLPITPVDKLKEYGIGELEGTAFSALVQDHDFFNKIFSQDDYAPPQGETKRQVRERILEAIAEIEARHRGEDVIIVSHGAVMGLALSHLLHQDDSQWGRYHVDNTALSLLSIGEQTELVEFNNCDHLTG